jgi:formylglycine-generating enzyme required for sulfatase activity
MEQTAFTGAISSKRPASNRLIGILAAGSILAILLGAVISAKAEPTPVASSPVANSIGLKLVEIKPGSYRMGSPASETGRRDDETQHMVTLTKGFFIATTHVTRGQFAAFVKDSGYLTEAEKDGWSFELVGTGRVDFSKVNGASWRNPGIDQTDDHPVVDVTWNDATAFCAWLSKKESKHYRLPTEAEWEYACRAGTTTTYYTGDGVDALTDAGWFSGNSNKGTHPVAQKKPNAWGLYDMLGNAWEWCSDWYGNYPDGDATDPQGISADAAPKFKIDALNYNGPARILKGGGFEVPLTNCRCANRKYRAPDIRTKYIGFRVVLDNN